MAAVSPSWGGPHLFPHIYNHGVDVLTQEFGLRVKPSITATANPDWLYHNPKARADDVNAAFADPNIKAIFATIGGSDSVRILPYLDHDVIRNNPKILIGFSDTTTLLTYINQLGLVTFQGPSIMAGFSQLRAMPTAFADHVRTMLFEAPESVEYAPYSVWSEGYPEWDEVENMGKTHLQQPNSEGWHWLQGDSTVQGRLFGGCVEVLEMMKGTAYWPQPAFWADKILFLETSEEATPSDKVMSMLRNYGMQGVFDQIKALLFARPMRYTDEAKAELEEVIITSVATEFGRPDLPIVANMDFGHTDPQLIMPLGVMAEVDCVKKRVRLVERVVI